MCTHLQQPMSDRCTCQCLVQPGSEHLVSLCSSQAPRVCVCVSVCACVCATQGPNDQHPDTTHIVFFSGARKRRVIYRAVWHWSTRMHDWLSLMEFSALDLHFSISWRSGVAHKHNTAAARHGGSHVSSPPVAVTKFPSSPTPSQLWTNYKWGRWVQFNHQQLKLKHPYIHCNLLHHFHYFINQKKFICGERWMCLTLLFSCSRTSCYM